MVSLADPYEIPQHFLSKIHKVNVIKLTAGVDRTILRALLVPWQCTKHVML